MRNKEFEALCKPVADYLQKNHNPYSKVIITAGSCALLSTELGVHFQGNENAVANDVPRLCDLKCEYCANEIDENDNYCMYCGKPIQKETV